MCNVAQAVRTLCRALTGASNQLISHTEHIHRLLAQTLAPLLNGSQLKYIYFARTIDFRILAVDTSLCSGSVAIVRRQCDSSHNQECDLVRADSIWWRERKVTQRAQTVAINAQSYDQIGSARADQTEISNSICLQLEIELCVCVYL